MTSIRRLRIAFVVVSVAAAVTHVAPHASATVINVTTTNDAIAVDGLCSLREAVIAANNDTAQNECPAGSGADEVQLQTGIYQLQIPGADEDGALTGDLDIGLGGLTISGVSTSNTFIDADGIDRAFHLPFQSSQLSIDNVVIRNGSVQGSDANNRQCQGGGIATIGGDVTVTDSVITLNDAGIGGGVYAFGGADVTLDNVEVRQNSAVKAGAGIVSTDGATVTINGGLIESNPHLGGLTANAPCANVASTGGGGLLVSGGTMTVNDATVKGNTTPGSGAGALAIGAQSVLAINRSTFDTNGAQTNGGAVRNQNSGVVTVSNSTITGNQASGGGGGLSSDGLSMTVRSATITGHTTGGIHGSGTTQIQNSIVNDGCTGVVAPGSLGHNIDVGTTCGFGADPTDRENLSTNLGPLADNGGPTRTHKLPNGSLAIETGSCPELTADQRGAPRPIGNCDVGAYESQPPTASITHPLAQSYNDATYEAGCSFGQDVCGTSGPGQFGPPVQSVEVQIQNQANDSWNGSAFVTGPPIWNSATGTAPWQFLFNPPVDGSYQLSVRATDQDGLVGGVSAVVFTVDNAAPTASIDSAKINKRRNKATFTFSANEGGTFQCALDGAAFTSCTTPKTYKRLKERRHAFQVRAIDTAGNVGAAVSRTFRV